MCGIVLKVKNLTLICLQVALILKFKPIPGPCIGLFAHVQNTVLYGLKPFTILLQVQYVKNLSTLLYYLRDQIRKSKGIQEEISLPIVLNNFYLFFDIKNSSH